MNNGVREMKNNKIFEILKSYKAVILYLVFGGITTIVNILTYAICFKVLGMENVVANIIAWLFAVIIAYITNKIWVFESKSLDIKKLLYELISFFGCRIITGIVDLIIMYIAVDEMQLNAIVMKIIANIVVIVSNYLASKYLIFKKK